MKNVSISLTDQHASEIDAQVSSGDFASVSEVVRAALRDFLSQPPGPSLDQIDRDIAAYKNAVLSGEALIDAPSAKDRIRRTIRK